MTYKEWKSSLQETPTRVEKDVPQHNRPLANVASLPNLHHAAKLGDRKKGPTTSQARTIDRYAPFNYKSNSSRQSATVGTNCAICIDVLRDKERVRGLPCNHCYHQKCIDPWLTGRRGSCPLCKRNYVTPDNVQHQSYQYVVHGSVELPSLPPSAHFEDESYRSAFSRTQTRIARVFFGERRNQESQSNLNELERGRS